MSIVTSTHTVDPRADVYGRRLVTERHTDDVGKVYVYEYLKTDAMDAQAIMTARATQINDQLAEAEAAALGDG